MGKILITVLSNAVGGVVIEKGFPDAVDRKLFEQTLAQGLDEASEEALELVSSVLDVTLNADKVFTHKGSLKVGDVEALLAGARNVKASTKEIRDRQGLVADPNPVEGRGSAGELGEGLSAQQEAQRLSRAAVVARDTGRAEDRQVRDALVRQLRAEGWLPGTIACLELPGLSERNVRRILGAR